MGLHLGDGSWDLKLLVTDLQVERTLRVHGGEHIGGVMIKLVDLLDIAMDWSDHAVWWPAKNIWLNNTRWTLDQYSITADEMLYFTPMHKTLRVQLPDLRFLDCKVDFAIKTFNSVVGLCTDLGIRHPEELSLCRPLDNDHLKFNYGTVKKEEKTRRITLAAMPATPRPDTNTFIANSETLRRKSTTSSPLHRKISIASSRVGAEVIGSPKLLSSTNAASYGSDWSLAMSPPPSVEAKETIVSPKTLVEKARMNVAWLDSSLSIMEQGIEEFDTLFLRFKYFSFYDLNPKEDPVRINLIYEQARWQIINEEIDCTEEEMLLFASLQLQVLLQANVPQPQDEDEDDVESALNELQISLDGGYANRYEDHTQIPQLTGYMKYLKPKRFTLKGYKVSYFVCKDLQLSSWKNSEDASDYCQEPNFSISLKGCEVAPDVNIHQGKYGIKLSVPSSDGMSDLWLRCDSESQYTQWMAACRLAAKGKSLADFDFDQEVSAIKAFLSMQHPAHAPAINPNTLDIKIEDYMAARFTKQRKGKIRHRILEAHANVKDLNLIEAKMNFIKAWQSLPEFGITLFVVKFHGERKEELLGICYNRVMRLGPINGDHITTWRYNTMKAWNVNWETGHMMLQLGTGENVIFQCVSAECKVVHEFIGGYIFLSMRSKESSQILNQELFHKLTGGWT